MLSGQGREGQSSEGQDTQQEQHWIQPSKPLNGIFIEFYQGINWWGHSHPITKKIKLYVNALFQIISNNFKILHIRVHEVKPLIELDNFLNTKKDFKMKL